MEKNTVEMDAGLGVKVDKFMNNSMIVMGYQATYWLYIVEHENFLYPSYSNRRPTKVLTSCRPVFCLAYKRQ